MEIFFTIMYLVILWLIFATFVMCCVTPGNSINLSILNPKVLRKHSKSLNWFGVVVSEIFLHIVMLPLALIYWFYFLMTVGGGPRDKDAK